MQPSPSYTDSYSPGGSSFVPSPYVGTSPSQSSKKQVMVDVFERMKTSVDKLVEVMREGNMVKNEQLQVAKRHAIAIERQNELMKRQNDLKSEQISIMRRSSPVHYLESEIWDMLVQLNLHDDLILQYYDYLCENPAHVRMLFGLPTHLRLNSLLKLMSGGGDSS
ncbi:hypothetical protein PHAVU_010G019800 [Phaseolus vulgaris]|uniref:Uncharacterized protein n=1 Tax=Phaseolus vulgaris TaxID=3885 RepID=V7ALG9_PHAVU|nr:hypothetical protein PHAVU_010G019800g [Phaseolus vulgaris]ESW06105.1 hypothetical protein PHAVU_010G019800g [Phaseolus vulgaris]